MLKLKLQYFGHLMWQADLLEKTLILGKIEGKRGRGRQRMRWLDDITDSMDMNLGKLWEMVRDRETSVHGIAKSQTWLSDRRRTTMKCRNNFHWEQWCAAWLNVKYYKEFCKNKQTNKRGNSFIMATHLYFLNKVPTYMSFNWLHEEYFHGNYLERQIGTWN